MTPSVANQIWLRLRAAGLVSNARPPALHGKSPWYVRLMMGFSGWIVALCLFGVANIAIRLENEQGAVLIALGLVLCLVAIVVDRVGDGDFATQFAFALGVTAQLLVFYGLYRITELDGRLAAALVFCFEAVLFFAIRGLLHRIWAALVASIALLYAITELQYPQLTMALLLALFASIWIGEYRTLLFRPYIRPVGYASLLALFIGMALVILGSGFIPTPHGEYSPSVGLRVLSALMLGTVAIATTYGLLREQALDHRTPPGLELSLVAVIMALLSFWAPGIAVAYVIFLIGFAHSNIKLIGAAGLILTVYLGHFYYELNLSLLQKSALLLTTGMLLMVMRVAVRNRAFPVESRAAGEDDA